MDWLTLAFHSCLQLDDPANEQAINSLVMFIGLHDSFPGCRHKPTPFFKHEQVCLVYEHCSSLAISYG
jgi:hypothetical protein